MNNNKINFDPNTGQPIKKDEPTGQKLQNAIINSSESNNSMQNQEQPNNTNVQNDLQSIATIDQSNEKFINNAQTASQEKENSSDGKMNYAFIFILFAVIFAAIFFLFPLISKYI